MILRLNTFNHNFLICIQFLYYLIKTTRPLRVAESAIILFGCRFSKIWYNTFRLEREEIWSFYLWVNRKSYHVGPKSFFTALWKKTKLKNEEFQHYAIIPALIRSAFVEFSWQESMTENWEYELLLHRFLEFLPLNRPMNTLIK